MGTQIFWKALSEQEIENEPGVALVGLLLAHLTGANLRGISDPQFVTEFREQMLEPMNGAGRFDPYAYRFVCILQTPVERLGFAALVVQAPLDEQLSSLFSGPWQSADSVRENHIL